MAKEVTYTSNHPYKVVQYDPAWPVLYERESERVQAIVGPGHPIHHIGGTSVPGLASKPQIDILVEFEEGSDLDRYNDALTQVGYTVYGDVLGKGGRLFSRWQDGMKTVNLQFHYAGSLPVREHLAVRDYLCSHPDEVAAYARLKLDLFERYPDDYLKYREYKDEFMRRLLQRVDANPECGITDP
ncbi:GrpB family protein [Patescibacteria group bacterium]|nr:GrpB family protein [Patescibacteria group bacterium]